MARMTAKPVKCPRCARENDPTFAFCLDCGAPIRQPTPQPAASGPRCSQCSAPLQPGFRFCGLCGTPVAGAAPPPRVPGAGGTGGHVPAVPSAPRPSAARIRLQVVRSDGLPGPVFAIDEDDAICGRTDGEIRFPDDLTVSPRHARFSLAGGALRVEDLGSVNGTFLRLREPRRVTVGEEVRVGRQLLRLEPLARPHHEEQDVVPWGTADLGYRYRLSQLLEGGGLGEIFPLREGTNLVGREAGEVVFPSDRYVSARHARIEVSGGEITLTDSGSSNGTFVKLTGAADLAIGDQLLIGGQLLRVEP
jgi:pSer/pThr/pTyr-binding forkhead associated (FHA) protein